jgi:hypothetical protein
LVFQIWVWSGLDFDPLDAVKKTIQVDLYTNPSNNLVGGLQHVLFFHILEIIFPTDFHIFQRGRSITNQ